MTITLDGTVQSTGGSSNAATQTLAITIGNNSNRFLVVQVGYETATPITSVKIGATLFTKIIADNGASSGYTSEIWGLTSTNGLGTGSVTITVTFGTTGKNWFIGAYSLYNVNQSTPTGATNKADQFNSGNIQGTVTPTNTGAWILDSMQTHIASPINSNNLTKAYSQAEGSFDSGNSQYSSTPTIGSSNTMFWNNNGAGVGWSWAGCEIFLRFHKLSDKLDEI